MNEQNQRLIDAMKLVTKMSPRIQNLLSQGATASEVYNEVLHVIAEAETVEVKA